MFLPARLSLLISQTNWRPSRTGADYDDYIVGWIRGRRFWNRRGCHFLAKTRRTARTHDPLCSRDCRVRVFGEEERARFYKKGYRFRDSENKRGSQRVGRQTVHVTRVQIKARQGEADNWTGGMRPVSDMATRRTFEELASFGASLANAELSLSLRNAIGADPLAIESSRLVKAIKR